MKGSPATAGCPDSDADGVRDSQDNCLVVANPDQRNSDSAGLGDACEPIDAVDDTRYVDYVSGYRAPAQQVDALANDVGGGRVLDGLGVSGPGWTPGAGDGLVQFTPPTSRFVGTASASYTIRFRLDPAGTVRDTARITLVYRTCRDHSLTLAGTDRGVRRWRTPWARCGSAPTAAP